MEQGSAKNILYIVPSAGIGGAETFLKTTYLFHNKNNFNPTYLLFRKGKLYDWLLEKNADVVLLPNPPRLSRPWDVLKTSLFIKKIIKQKNIELVHSTMAYGAIFAGFASWFSAVPHIWFQHGPVAGWMDKLAAIIPHKVIFHNSHYTLAAQVKVEKSLHVLKRVLGRKTKRYVVDLGIESKEVAVEPVQQFRQKLLQQGEYCNSAIVFAMACRLQKWKGVDLLVEATSLLQDLNGRFAVFIFGEKFDSDEYVKALFAKAQNLPVHFMGPVNDIYLPLAASDVLVNASINPEPFGLSLIEAMSVGTAVIAPNEGGPAEFISNEQSGLLFKARSNADLAEKMRQLILNREKLNALKRNGKAEFDKRFHANKMMHTLENIYNEVSNS